jgi:outer membrane protein assembly factor BamB
MRLDRPDPHREHPKVGLHCSLLLVALLLGACTSGGSPSCDTKGGTVLANTAWPKFRNDQANTGLTTVAIPSGNVSAQRLFPPEGSTIGGIVGTPVLGSDRIYLGSNDDNVYVFYFDGQPVDLEKEMETNGPIIGTPLVGEDGTLFVVSGDGNLYQFETNGKIHKETTIGGSLSASPNIGFDGTVYFGSLGGSFTGVCANGAARFLRTTSPSGSSPAVTADVNNPDDLVIIGAADNGQVRGFDKKGRLRWSLFVSAAATIRAAIVIDEGAQRFFVADQTGRVFASNIADGNLDNQFAFRASAPITASPALGNDVLYVADQLGVLYAVDPSTGNILWQWSATADLELADGIEGVATSIRSSPALSAPDGETERLTFGVDIGPADVFCRVETTCTVDEDCPTVNCCGADGICSQTGTSCNPTLNDCEHVNSCENGVCAIRRGDCVCGGCTKVNVCVNDACSETGTACTSDDDCPVENACVRSFLYTVEGGSQPTTVWRVPFDASIGTASPAIGSDGTVYIGTEAGVLYSVAE